MQKKVEEKELNSVTMSRNDLDSKYGNLTNHQKGSQTYLKKLNHDSQATSQYYDEEESRSFNLSPDLKQPNKVKTKELTKSSINHS